MATYIKPGNIFGRIGTGIGKGLAEQLPKEIERGRLGAGLEKLGKQKGLTPFEQFTGLVKAAHEYPQVVQSGADLLRTQNTLDAFRRQRGMGASAPTQASTGTQQLPGFMEGQMRPERPIAGQEKVAPQEIVPGAETGQPQILPENPLRPEVRTVRPMTPQEKVDDIANLADQYPNMTYPELKAMSDENETRRIAQPEAARAEDDRLRGIQDRLRTNFNKLLEQKLQKEGRETYADLTGEMQNNLVRSMNRELRERPDASEDDVVNKWTQKALELAKAKTKLTTIMDSSRWATPVILNKDQYRKGLEDLSDIYAKAGNSEEFYNTMRTYGFSPRGAGQLAYKTNPNLSKYIQSAPRGSVIDPKISKANSRKIAVKVEEMITPQDSILAIANQLISHDPLFSLGDFLDQIREDRDFIGLNPRQQRELSEAAHLLPTWADIVVLPWR